MNRLLCLAAVAALSAAGCGDEKKPTAPTGGKMADKMGNDKMSGDKMGDKMGDGKMGDGKMGGDKIGTTPTTK